MIASRAAVCPAGEWRPSLNAWVPLLQRRVGRKSLTSWNSFGRRTQRMPTGLLDWFRCQWTCIPAARLWRRPLGEAQAGQILSASFSSRREGGSPGRSQLSGQMARHSFEPYRARMTSAALACPYQVCLPEVVVRNQAGLHLFRRQRRGAAALEVVAAMDTPRLG